MNSLAQLIPAHLMLAPLTEQFSVLFILMIIADYSLNIE